MPERRIASFPNSPPESAGWLQKNLETTVNQLHRLFHPQNYRPNLQMYYSFYFFFKPGFSNLRMNIDSRSSERDRETPLDCPPDKNETFDVG